MFRVFPAPAGINRQPRVDLQCVTCVPRASGDKPGAINGGRAWLECSPRQRG
ncbi:TPA: hypothetical protein JLH43_000003 [Escherichia coli]|nr:hypothetical protein [Escherichia coli]